MECMGKLRVKISLLSDWKSLLEAVQGNREEAVFTGFLSRMTFFPISINAFGEYLLWVSVYKFLA